MKKLDPNGHTYRREAIQLAFDSAPQIFPRAGCGHPVVSGYCCDTCGSTDPTKRSEPAERKKGKA